MKRRNFSRRAALKAALPAFILTLTISASGCAPGNPGAGNTSASSVPALTAADTAARVVAAFDSSADLGASTETFDGAVNIALSGTDCKVDGSGAAFSGKTLTISAAGTYVLTGRMEDGQIIVAAGEDAEVELVLAGASLSCSDSSALYCQSAKKLKLHLAAGTSNYLSDGASYTTAAGDEVNAAVYSVCDLNFEGDGALTVYGNCGDAVHCKKDLKLKAGTVNVKAADDGLIGRKTVKISGGTLKIEATGDGIKATKTDDTEAGIVELSGGEIGIMAGADAVQASNLISVTGGSLDLLAGGGAANATVKQDGFTFNRSSDDSSSSGSEKGLKASGGITVSGGTVRIDSCDDALHTKGDLTVSGGALTILSGDDALHAGGTLGISEGSIDISSCYEGLEASQIDISGGTTSLVSSDDGVNIAGGSDVTDGRAQDSFNSVASGNVNVSGGSLTIDAGGDGIDSNGGIAMSGGTVVIYGPTDSSNGAIDYNGSFDFSGGVLTAAGSAGMHETTSDTSTANSVSYIFDTAQNADTEAELVDSSGSVVMSITPPKTYQAVVFASADIRTGETYTVQVGGTAAGTVTVSSPVTTGGAEQAGMPGGGKH